MSSRIPHWRSYAVTSLVLVVLYLGAWPVPVDPVAWDAPANPGYTGPFAVNTRLAGIETFPIGDNHGPEDIAVDRQGRIHAGTGEGRIVRLQPDGSRAENWVQTGGRPLGMEFDADGNLIVADAIRGLLAVAPDGTIQTLATEADGIPIRYADDLDVTSGGDIYFSDATVKFGAAEYGGTYAASLLDILEHGGHGRLLVYSPATGKTTTVLSGLNFANGVAVSHDDSYVLVNETASYRILRVWIAGPRKGTSEALIEALPAFPDNISRGTGGRFWVALVSPRNALLDSLSQSPFLRKVLQRMPAFIRPAAGAYGHVIAIDGDGSVVEDLQDPQAAYPVVTGVTETEEHLYLGSLVTRTLARLPKAQAGL